MILRTIFLLTFLRSLHSHPNPQRLNLPDLDISPEEVNSLEREEPIRRSINPQNDQNNIEDTVKEVEEIIKNNPALPRLTRGEILDLLENITSLDEQKAKVLGGKREPKAVMVVMPYTPTNDKNLEDFYTKAPVTQIIGEPFKPKEEIHRRRKPDLNDDNDLAKRPLPEEKKKYSASISEKPTKPVSLRNPIRRKRPEATTQAIHTPTTYKPTTYSTSQRSRRRSTTRHPNHRYPEESIPSGGLRVIESPKLKPAQNKNDIASDLEVQENIRHEVVVKPNSISNQNVIQTATTQKPIIEGLQFPPNLETVVKDLNLEVALNPPKVEPKVIDDQERIRNMLASLGVFRKTTTTTTTTAAPNAESVAESLSPEMRDLLMNFGLLPNPNEKPIPESTEKYYPEKAEYSPDSYIGFKPLPDDAQSRNDMEALLASFGLGRSIRREKSLKPRVIDQESYNFDMIPDNLKGVITDLGLEKVKRESKEIRGSSVDKNLNKGQSVNSEINNRRVSNEITTEKNAEKQHVFNPDTQYATEEELEKLEKLIGMVRELEKMNGTINEETLKKIDLESLKELVKDLNESNNETVLNSESNKDLITLENQDSPDPTAFDVGLTKNEVKRQEATTVGSTVTEAATPSLKDLEDSFGGKTDPPTEPPIPQPTTSKSGFYHLVDWNTFLDIDDTKGKRVNLRFQPTIGDPKRFLSVSVP